MLSVCDVWVTCRRASCGDETPIGTRVRATRSRAQTSRPDCSAVLVKRESGRCPSVHSTQRGRGAAMVHSATLRQIGRPHAFSVRVTFRASEGGHQILRCAGRARPVPFPGARSTACAGHQWAGQPPAKGGSTSRTSASLTRTTPSFLPVTGLSPRSTDEIEMIWAKRGLSRCASTAAASTSATVDPWNCSSAWPTAARAAAQYLTVTTGAAAGIAEAVGSA